MNILISLSCSTLSILCYFNKHIHATVVSHLALIQYLCGSSALFCRWFIQPLTGGSLWTSEHIRRHTQGPSTLIMSDHSVHGQWDPPPPPSLSLWLYPSPSSSLTHINTHTIYFTHLHNCSHATYRQHVRGRFVWVSEDSWGAIFQESCKDSFE